MHSAFLTNHSTIPRSPDWLQQITVVLNPVSGRGTGAKRKDALHSLLNQHAQRYGQTHSLAPPHYEIVETTTRDRGAGLAADAVKRGASLVAAAGGDGTLSEVANGLVGTGAILGLLPMGTGNDCARCLQIAFDPETAVRTLFEGTPMPVDLGETQGRYFLNVAGCGFDAVVAERVNRGFRYLRGTAAYIAAVVQTLMRYRAAGLRLTLDEEPLEVRAMMCSVANATSYGGGMKIAPDAKMDDGLFDVCIVKEAGKIEFLRTFPRVFNGTHTTHPKVLIRQARQLRIESDRPLPILVDGDVYGTTPVEFTIHPKAIEIVVPTVGKEQGKSASGSK